MRFLVDIARGHPLRLFASLTKKCNFMSTAMSTTLFEGQPDRFRGITVHSSKEPCAPADFGRKLTDSLRRWRETQMRGIWFRVHVEHADWVPHLAKNGFRYHNARDDFVTMYLWLPEMETCNIPPFAHTLLGVGAVVVNDRSQVLVVSEKYNETPHWKLPGGYVEPGENLVDAAIREVHEETNIRTEFVGLLTLRQSHHGMFGCSDIYTVVSLRPINETIAKCERELAEAKWMDVEEYLRNPLVHELNRFFVEKYLEYREKNVKIDWKHGIHQVLKKPYSVYFMTDADSKN